MSELDMISEQRRRFLRVVCDLAQGQPMRLIRKVEVAQRLGLDVSKRAGFEEFMAIAQHFSPKFLALR